MSDYYTVLGVTRDAGTETIKAQYRKLAKTCHPDLFPEDKGAETRFKSITEAWETLGDREKRDRYDQTLAARYEPKRKPSAAPMGEVDIDGLFEKYMGIKR